MSFVESTDEIKEIIDDLRRVREFIKNCLEQEEVLKKKLYNIINENEGIIDLQTGETLATWKYNSESVRFDAKLFKEENPLGYAEYCKIQPGARILRITK
jgi:hypothetical protein